MKSATMFSALHKSKQLSIIMLDRMGDYLDLLRVELKIREHDIVLKLAGYAVAGLFGLLATVFLGLAIIVSFWDSSYRALAAWFVVLLYGGIAALSLRYSMKHFKSQSLATTLRSEMRRDIDTIKESI
jgi:uncharacterized membrane protein YqjE